MNFLRVMAYVALALAVSSWFVWERRCSSWHPASCGSCSAGGVEGADDSWPKDTGKQVDTRVLCGVWRTDADSSRRRIHIRRETQEALLHGLQSWTFVVGREPYVSPAVQIDQDKLLIV